MAFAMTVKPEQIEQKWYLVDARDVVLGRLSTKVASLLLGKHRPYFSPQWDMGDHVVVINASRVRVTGKKETDKLYHSHTGYPGGLRSQNVMTVREKYPERLIERAVRGMLPKNRLLDKRLEKLHVFAGAEHAHAAQKPETITID